VTLISCGRCVNPATIALLNYFTLYWHQFFLAITTTFTELNTVMPAMIIEAGGDEFSVGLLTAIMVGLPLISQLLFAGFLHTRPRKKPFLLLAINLRVLALVMAAVSLAIGSERLVITLIFLSMALFAVSGAFAGVSYTDIIGSIVARDQRRRFFVTKQVVFSVGVLLSAIVTRFLLAARSFPDGYVLLFGMAAAFLLVASLGFWALDVPERKPTNNLPQTVSLLETYRQVPAVLRGDKNLRHLVLASNLAAPALTSLPFIMALAHRTYAVDGATVGYLVLLQIAGMLLSSKIWSRLISARGFRSVLVSMGLVAGIALPAALVLHRVAPLWVYALLFPLMGAVDSARRVGVESVLIEVAPPDRRALYTGIYGALNLAMAFIPLFSGVLIRRFGFTGVLIAASVFALLSATQFRKLHCEGTSPG